MIKDVLCKRSALFDVLCMAHIESSLIWIGSLKVEWEVCPTSSKSAAIPYDVTHITIFSSLQSLTTIMLYKKVLPVPASPSRKNVVPLCSFTDVKTS
jgi:hypothetical protein